MTAAGCGTGVAGVKALAAAGRGFGGDSVRFGCGEAGAGRTVGTDGRYAAGARLQPRRVHALRRRGRGRDPRERLGERAEGPGRRRVRPRRGPGRAVRLPLLDRLADGRADRGDRPDDGDDGEADQPAPRDVVGGREVEGRVGQCSIPEVIQGPASESCSSRRSRGIRSHPRRPEPHRRLENLAQQELSPHRPRPQQLGPDAGPRRGEDVPPRLGSAPASARPRSAAGASPAGAPGGARAAPPPATSAPPAAGRPAAEPPPAAGGRRAGAPSSRTL